ncbi:stealth family protein [Microbacterium sp. EYE_5]|uniref:stealth conserved region 3 domain-containing protein n=1 Tax=unclassified Microbacterium TaxID=2609290 RepID=UPI002005CF43|nr:MULTISPECIES: stealth conserved region 3 domain-containing protein [unclassified Microbacterium]MCK6081142.1 stealth family protein [Microbacterium sp. EYE_382]MCK6086412.1 stealth family protein [Microbacterium sp. EYE_384]MCK6124090.1 stealth family protein [Microbacterium sp. EYE_80]MCK6126999.1 stealth family protein [Microbacterium sp. EYE_79]MCK6142097.1 stealth family protein [Microbacterium sp. EYE_39]
MARLTALPSEGGSWTGLLDREDIVLIGGMLHLRHDDITPEQARIADLLLVSDTLGDAGVPHLLIRHSHGIPGLAVDLDHRDRAVAALAQRAVTEPVYAKAKGGASVPLAEFRSAATGPSSVRLFRPRVVGELRYGAGHGIRLEFWRFGEELVEAPHANDLSRRLFAAEDVEPTTVDRYGRTWQTLHGMFDPHPADVTHDIDMVFSWVDGSSTDFQRQRAAQLSEYVVGEGDDGPARYRHVDELRYALRSVHMYAPWVRRIFIATDSPAPAWLLDHPKVTIVRSEEFFEDTSVLPTHNSHAVEAQLHRIEGLSEHFLYSNDDMFFGRPVRPDLFFSPAGISSFVECEVRIGTGPRRTARSGHDNALRLNRELLRERFGRTIVRDLEHCAAPLRRSIAYELEREFPEEIRRTAASRFRSATDVSVTNCLYHYYAAFTGRAIASSAPRVRYFQTTQAASLRQMEKLTERSDVDMFCLNDGGDHEVPEAVRVRAVTELLERLFPVRAPWEDPAVSAAPARPLERHA